MTNREAIEAIKANYPPENYTILREALDMACVLLERLEPVDPVEGPIGWRCGHCHARIEGYSNFCHNCGRLVKWK